MPAQDAFGKALMAFADKVEAASLIAFKAATVQAHGVADGLTPVLTGKTRANNQVAINTLEMDEINEEDLSGGGAKSRALSRSETLKLGDTAVLGNPLEHVVDLEAGSSSKSPGGMYAMAREEAPGFFQQAFLAAMK